MRRSTLRNYPDRTKLAQCTVYKFLAINILIDLLLLLHLLLLYTSNFGAWVCAVKALVSHYFV